MDEPIHQPVPQTSQQPMTPPVTKPNYSNSIKIIVAVTLLLLGLVSISLLLFRKSTPVSSSQNETTITNLSTTPNPVKEWTTFQNEMYGVSFQYPKNKNWSAETVTDYDQILSEELLRVEITGDLYSIGLDPTIQQTKVISALFEIFKNPQSNFENYLNEQDTKLKLPQPRKVYYVTDTQGRSWNVREYHTPTNEILTTEYSINEKNYLYQFHLYSLEPAVQKAFIQILSTFTDQSQAADVTNWKIYTNSKNNYSIKYPSEWKVVESNELEENINSLVGFSAIQAPYHQYVTIIVYNNGENLSIEDLVKKYIAQGKFQYTPIKVDEIQGEETEDIPGATDYFDVFVKKSSKIYQIRADRTIGGQLFSQILSTFKFTH